MNFSLNRKNERFINNRFEINRIYKITNGTAQMISDNVNMA